MVRSDEPRLMWTVARPTDPHLLASQLSGLAVPVVLHQRGMHGTPEWMPRSYFSIRLFMIGC